MEQHNNSQNLSWTKTEAKQIPANYPDLHYKFISPFFQNSLYLVLNDAKWSLILIW